MKLIKNLILVSLLVAFVVSCDDSEENTGHSKVSFSTPSVTYAIIANNTNLTIDESTIDPDADEKDANTGDYKNGVYIIEATLSEPVQVDTYIDLTQTSGSASSSDFTVERIYVPALHSTGTGKIIIQRTGEEEGDETLTVTANTNSSNANGSEDFTFSITNDYLNPEFNIIFDWCSDYEFDFGDGKVTGNFGDEIDLDMKIYDSSFTELGYIAGSSSCPEVAPVWLMPDGTYYITIDLYFNNLDVLGINQPVPVTISYEREFFVPNTEVAHTYNLNTDMSSGNNLVLQVDKTGDDYVVTGF